MISGVAKAAQESAASGSSLQEALDALCAAAAEAVALTPTMLPVLHDAGVVDAGGHGLSVILEGLRTYATGDEVHLGELQVPAPVGVEVSSGAVSQQFLEATDEEMYGYCTQFLIRGSDMNTEAIRERMASLALSTAVVGDDTMVKVHVHAHDPGPIVSFAVSLGTLSQVKIENMDDQHREYSAARLRAAPDGAKDGAVPIAVVVVASGQGLATVFTDLGAAFVLSGGDTMNPSVQDILNAVESVPSENVILLPNNGNIVPAAKQAIELSEKRLRVIPASTIPEGIAAMLAFNPENDLDDNESEMLRMLPSVRTGEICRAVRPVELNGIAVEEGRIIGLIGRELVAAGGEPNEVLVSLLREAEIAEGELVTLYWGDPLSQEIADAGRRRVEAAFSGAEVEVVAGGQPYYHYIVSIE